MDWVHILVLHLRLIQNVLKYKALFFTAYIVCEHIPCSTLMTTPPLPIVDNYEFTKQLNYHRDIVICKNGYFYKKK